MSLPLPQQPLRMQSTNGALIKMKGYLYLEKGTGILKHMKVISSHTEGIAANPYVNDTEAQRYAMELAASLDKEVVVLKVFGVASPPPPQPKPDTICRKL